MPSVEWNLQAWDKTYDWSREGEEWSDGIGGSRAQWFWWLLPRISSFLPARRTLEIAPGFGRWTSFLLEHVESLTAVDLAPRCVEVLRERFAGREHFQAFANNGYTLPMIADESIDFAFSFGSLVHVEMDVMASYLKELSRVLDPKGVAFLHHSNVAAVPNISHHHNFGLSVSAVEVEQAARSFGLVPVLQEVFSWGSRPDEAICCMSVLARPEAPAAVRNFVRFLNPRIDADAAYVGAMSSLWLSGR